MFIIPFISPLGYSLESYQNTSIKIPVVEKGLFGERRVFKGSPAYDLILKSNPGYKIKTAMQPFLNRIGIRKDLNLIEKSGKFFAEGTNFFTRGDSVIWIPPDFHDVDQDACHWAIKHEVSHIKNNDCFTIPLVPAICSMATASFSTFVMPVLPALLLTSAVGAATRMLFARYCEEKADDFAIAESSEEELKGGRRMLISLQQSVSSLDPFHPSLESRLKKIERALEQRNAFIKEEEEEEAKKIALIKNLFTKII
jgi:Peptidase family M48